MREVQRYGHGTRKAVSLSTYDVYVTKIIVQLLWFIVSLKITSACFILTDLFHAILLKMRLMEYFFTSVYVCVCVYDY